MSAFEFTFGLISLLLGLGFAHVAGAFARLIIAGPKVRWDWLSPLAAVLMLLMGLIYWWSQWSLRDEQVVLSDLTIRAVGCLFLYVMAVAVLPDRTGKRINLRNHFERSRRLVYGSLAAHVATVGILPDAAAAFSGGGSWGSALQNMFIIALLLVGIFTPRPWVNGALLSGLLLLLGFAWMTRVIAS